METIYFDNSLPKFASFISKNLGMGSLTKNFFLRDAFGKLSFILLDSTINSDERTILSKKSEKAMGNYVDHDGFAITTPEELFDDTLKNISIAKKIHINTKEFEGFVLVFERRIVGADWLKSPQTNNLLKPARIVFSSIKGGVGRSTALCVVAAALSREGKRVLAVDMDLEAPGLGSMLLTNDVLPIYGLLDFFVEKNLNDLDNKFFLEIVGPSWISKGRGRVDVIPALGKKSIDNPHNVLSKIARAYLSKNEGGIEKSFMDYMNDFIEQFSSGNRYDVILIDARSGLHETTASAMIGLDAEILCFGADQPQTLMGYDLLFSHLSTMTDTHFSWLNKLHFIHAKAPEKIVDRERFSQAIENKLSTFFIEKAPEQTIDVSSLKNTFEVDWATEDELSTNDELFDSEDKINPIIAVLDDKRFQNFDPLSDSDSLSESVYTVTFGPLLDRVRTIVSSVMEDGGV